MFLTAREISDLVSGVIEGDSQVQIETVAKIEEAQKGSLSFLSNTKYENFLYTTNASAVLVSDQFVPSRSVTATLIKVKDPYSAFTRVLESYFNKKTSKQGIEAQAFVDETAKVGEGSYIGAFSYISSGASVGNNTAIHPQVFLGENVSVGSNCTIFPGVKIYDSCTIGDNCIIHAGTVIGSDGFGFAPQANGTFKKIPQTGNVIIEDDVEIGSNCSIDRATMGSTIIRKGVKLDNLIQVAHNVEIGANTVIAAQTGISGSTKLGNNCYIGGQVGFVGHITVAPGTQVGAQSGIPKAIKEPGKQWIGTPIQELKEAFKTQVIYRNLPSLELRVRELEKLLKESGK